MPQSASVAHWLAQTPTSHSNPRKALQGKALPTWVNDTPETRAAEARCRPRVSSS
jgi:hypothetical protein